MTAVDRGERSSLANRLGSTGTARVAVWLEKRAETRQMDKLVLKQRYLTSCCGIWVKSDAS